MKMKAGTRIIFSLVMLAVIALCTLVILTAVGVVSISALEPFYYGFIGNYGWVYIAAAALLGVICFCLLFFGIKGDKPKSVVISSGEDGNVEMVLDAFKELVSRYLEQQTEVLTQKICVTPVNVKEVKIKLELSAKPETDIPAVCERIKSGLKECLEMYSGVTTLQTAVKINPFRQQNTK